MSRKAEAVAGKAEIIALSIVTALSLAGDSFLYVALPLHWTEAGLGSIFEVGIILAANRIARIPLNPLITLFYSRFSCRTGVFLATLLAILTTAGYGLAQGLALWLLLRFVWGLSWSLLRLGSLYSILRVSTPVTLGYLTGLNNGLYRLGSLMGMFLGGVLCDSFGLRFTAFVLAGIACLSPLVVLARVPRVENERPKIPDGSGRRFSAVDWRVLFRKEPGPVLWVMMTGFIVAMAFEGLAASSISVLLNAHAGEQLLLFGLCLSVGTISGTIQSLRWVWEPFLSPLAGRVSDGRLGRLRLTALSFLVTALVMLWAATPMSLPSLCLVLLLLLLCGTVLTTASSSLANDAATHSEDSHLFLSAVTLFIDLGAAMGPMLAYFIIVLTDVSLAWIIMALLLTVFAVYWWRRKSLPGMEKQRV